MAEGAGGQPGSPAPASTTPYTQAPPAWQHKLAGGRGALWLCFGLSLLMVVGLYRAGGYQPYSAAPGYHYGINSPLEAVFLPLPAEARVYAAQYFLMLRAALAGVALCWYLRRHIGGVSLLLPVLSTAYAAGVYTACVVNSAWVDAAVLLPLLLDTVDRLIATGRGRRFGWLVFACVLANCYTAWPLIIFCFLYMVWQCVAKPGPVDFACLRSACRGYLAGLVPGAVAALLCLAPVLWGYLQKGLLSILMVAHPMSFSIQDVMYCLFYGRYSLSASGQGLPYLYSGMGAVALGLLYFFSPNQGRHGTRQKFASTFLLAAVAASYMVELPGIRWQSGADVTEFPFRYGFMFSAVLLLFAADTLLQPPPATAAVAASLVFGGIWVLGYPQHIGTAFSAQRFGVGICLYLGAVACLWLRGHRPAWRRAATVLLAGLLLADVYASSCITLYGVLR
ncbi:MAG: YfhO family protein [Gemmiger sp.]|nr:YfhO family protein [Gemmiger sp.]